jgi:hypothetical protein
LEEKKLLNQSFVSFHRLEAFCKPSAVNGTRTGGPFNWSYFENSNVSLFNDWILSFQRKKNFIVETEILLLLNLA